MKKLQRMLCLLTALILLAVQLPALAQEALLTQQEIAEARQLIAMEGELQGWAKGMKPSASMNALQIQQYLEWLLSDEIAVCLCASGIKPSCWAISRWKGSKTCCASSGISWIITGIGWKQGG